MPPPHAAPRVRMRAPVGGTMPSLSLTEHPPPFGVGAAAPDDGEEQEQEPILHTLAQSDRQKAEDRLDRSHGLGYAHVHGQYQ